MAESSAAELPVDPTAYAAFIDQVELVSIWLRHAQVENRHNAEPPEKGIFDIDRKARWEPRAAGFVASQTYTVQIKAADAILAECEVTFALEFTSKEDMTDALFDVFSDVNLPVNTWPYLREFLASVLGRFGWLPFTLPAYKVGARPAAPSRRQRKASRSQRTAPRTEDG